MHSRFHPYHGDAAEYPTHLTTDFRKLRMAALAKYCEEFDLPAQRDGPELAVVVAKHFESTLDVDEDECITSFMSSIRRAPGGAGDVASARDRAEQRQTGAANGAASLGDAYMGGDEYGAPLGYAATSSAAGYGHYAGMASGAMAAGAAGAGNAGMVAPGMHPAHMGGVQVHAMAAQHDMYRQDVPMGMAPAGAVSGYEVDEEPMIGCEGPDCPKQWWRLCDVGLTAETVPQGDWFCPACRLYPNDHSIARAYKGRGKPGSASQGSGSRRGIKPSKRTRRR